MKARLGSLATVTALITAVTVAITVTNGVTAPARADNSGRRICLYGLYTESVGGSGADTLSGTEFAIADYKEGGSCPSTSSAGFLKALGRPPDAQISYPWWGESKEKLTCEDFLQSPDYLEGNIPEDFPVKDVDSFCDNTDDDVLYSFRKSVTVDDANQRHITVTATNTKAKIGSDCNSDDPESRCWGFQISQTQAIAPRGVTVEVSIKITPPADGSGKTRESKELIHDGPKFFDVLQAKKVWFTGEYINEPGWTYTMHLRIHPSNGDTLEDDYDATKYQCFKISRPSGVYRTGDSSSGCTLS